MRRQPKQTVRLAAIVGVVLLVTTAGCLSYGSMSSSSSPSNSTGSDETPNAETLVRSSVSALENLSSYSFRHRNRLSTDNGLTRKTTLGHVDFSNSTAELTTETTVQDRDVETRLTITNSTVYSEGEDIAVINSLRQYLSETDGLRVDYYPVSTLRALAESDNTTVTETTYDGGDAYRISTSEVSDSVPDRSSNINRDTQIETVVDAETRLPVEINYTVSESEGETTMTETLRISDPQTADGRERKE
ncbi:MAG: hypothetical protein SV253_07455 [Halobacteria archaeon]|nr:hypothetical protein [Halobacteria archaeon]